MSTEKTKLTDKKWFVLILLFLVYPIGVMVLFLSSNAFEKKMKLYLAGGFGLLFLVFIYVNEKGKSADEALAQETLKEVELLLAQNDIESAKHKLEAFNKTHTVSLISDVLYDFDEATDYKTVEKELVEMSDTNFEKLQAGQLDKKYFDSPILNSYFLRQLQANKSKRTGLQEYKADMEDKSTLDDKVKESFHFYDGSHIGLERWIKKDLQDPDSYQHVSTIHAKDGDYLVVKTKFRAKNKLGALVLSTVVAKCDLDGNVIDASYINE